MRVLELFGGIGACTQALKRVGMDVEVVDYVEIDKYACASYNAINGTNFEPQDICTWDKNIEVDLIMHGSPCQDFSVAGKQAGGDVGSGTRSSLMYETIRIVGKLRPKYVIWENVKNLLSAKHRHNFDAYLETMKALGYTSYYQVLNAKDYGIPQNRERVFTVSIRNGNENNFEFPQKQELNKIPLEFIENDVDGKYDLTEKNKLHYQREFGSKGKEIDLYQPIPTLTAAMGSGGGNIPYFEFPPKQLLEKRLKDLLEDEVEEKYYLSQKMIDGFSKHNENHTQKGTGFIWKPKTGDDVASCLRANAALCPTDNTVKIQCIQVGTLDMKGYDSMKRVYSDEGLSPTLTTMGGGNTEPKVITAAAMRGRYNEDIVEQKIEVSDREYANAITTVQKDSLINDNYRIRKLTPKECWRLMGFDDEDFEKAAKVNSSTQLYKQAGNSIVVNVLEAIFKKLF